ncbi:MAG: hypothetical protein QOE61_1125 [Micromonosporaceae bacterium]|nr:hypothetical protein [Micromonosporaceae bacterium]
MYGLARLDDKGRVADHAIVRAMGWLPGVRLDIREAGGVILVRVSGQGVFTVTGQGHVRLPATVRRWCHLEPGDRVLLTAEPAEGLLVVHPPAALDTMLTRFHEQALGGDLA